MADNQLSPTEELLMLKVAMIAVATVAASIFTISTWHRALAWLVEHQVLVAANDSPLLRLPAADGIGIDAPRLAVAVAVLGIVLAGLGSAWRHRRELRDREQLR